MAFSATGVKASFAGSGTGPYAIPATMDVELDDDGNATNVKIASVDNAGTVLTGISAASISGRNVTTSVNYPVTTTITIYRDSPLTQGLDLEQDSLVAETLEAQGLDAIMRTVGELSEAIDRCVKIPITESGITTEIGDVTANKGKFLYLNDSEVFVMAAQTAGSATISTYGESLVDDADAPSARATLNVGCYQLSMDEGVSARDVVGLTPDGNFKQGVGVLASGTAQVGGTTLSWAANRYLAMKRSASQFVAIGTDGTDHKAILGSFTGTTVSWGTEATVEAGVGSNVVGMCVIDASTVVVVHWDTGAGYEARVLQCTNNVIDTVGAQQSIPNDYIGAEPDPTKFQMAVLDSTHIACAYYHSTGATTLGVIVGTVSGTTITWGTEQTFTVVTEGSATNSPHHCVALDSTHFVVCYEESGGTIACRVCVTDGGNTINTLGAEVTDILTGGKQHWMEKISATEWALWGNNTGTDMEIAFCSYSGSTVTIERKHAVPAMSSLGSAALVNNGSLLIQADNAYGSIIQAALVGAPHTDQFHTGHLWNEWITQSSAGAGWLGPHVLHMNDEDFVVCYIDASGDVYGQVFQIAPIFMGLAEEDIGNGATGEVRYEGVSSGHTSLTQGAIYYAQGDGTLVANPRSGGIPIGIAISTTEILMTHGRLAA